MLIKSHKLTNKKGGSHMRENPKEDFYTTGAQILILSGIIAAILGSVIGVWRFGLFAGFAIESATTYALARLGWKLIR